VCAVPITTHTNLSNSWWHWTFRFGTCDRLIDKELISASMLYFFQCLNSAVKRGRSAMWSEIMTCSPFKNSLLNVIKKKRANENLRWFYCWRTIVFRKKEDAQWEKFLSWLWLVITAKNRKRHCTKCQKCRHERCSSLARAIAFKCDIC